MPFVYLEPGVPLKNSPISPGAELIKILKIDTACFDGVWTERPGAPRCIVDLVHKGAADSDGPIESGILVQHDADTVQWAFDRAIKTNQDVSLANLPRAVVAAAPDKKPE